MAEFDPLSMFFMLVKVAGVILVIIFFFVLYQAFSKEISFNNLDTYSMEASEAVSSSPLLTDNKYVFNTDKLTVVNNKYIYVAHSCEFDYTADMQDLVTGDSWNFQGYTASDALSSNYINKKTNYFYVSVNSTTGVHPAQLTLVTYDSWFTEVTCLVQKSFYEKKVTNITMPGCVTNGEDATLCLSLKRFDANTACYYTNKGTIKWADCRYFPAEISFDDTYLAASSSLNMDGAKVAIAYPLNSNNAGVDCSNVKSSAAVWKDSDSGQPAKVLLCLEDVV